MAKEDAAQRAWKASISTSFDGDSAPGNSNFNVKTLSEISRGGYPRELRFKTGTQFQLKKSTTAPATVNVNITDALLNYDYHTSPAIEIYGFMERFSSEFLGIDQRYEIGFGLKREWEFGQVRNENHRKPQNVFDLEEEEKTNQRREEKDTDKRVIQEVKCWFGIPEPDQTGCPPLDGVSQEKLPPVELVERYLKDRNRLNRPFEKEGKVLLRDGRQFL